MDEDREQSLLRVALLAARAAERELLPRFGAEAQGVRTKTTPTDLVSDADVAAEDAIRSVLRTERPMDAIIGEEEGTTDAVIRDPEAATKTGGSSEEALRWVIDPLDGTVNFLFGIPAFAVSVACEDSEGTVAGVILDPIRQERFAATRSGAATVNDVTLEEVRRASTLDIAMIATGFGYDAAVRARQAEVVGRVLPRVRDIRRFGAAALDLAWTACGRFDAYYERGLHEWDLAAGSLIASRAGLEVRRLPPRGEDAWGVVVAPRAFADELYELVD